MTTKEIMFAGLFLCLLLMTGCGKHKSKQEMFDEHLAVNVEACASVLKASGVDSTVAKEKCTCLLKTAFAIDSNFVSMKSKKQTHFLQKNRIKMEHLCDSVALRLYLQKSKRGSSVQNKEH